MAGFGVTTLGRIWVTTEALVEFHHSQAYRFVVSGSLASNMGPCPEAKALEYFDTSVMGKVTDAFGRGISIEQASMRSLYKDHATGRHEIDSENYEELRGKRLPWIRDVLAKSTSVYLVEEMIGGKPHKTYLYTGIASIPLSQDDAVNYFIVVGKEDANRNMRFVTAYPVFEYDKFLSRIEAGVPMKAT